MKFFCTAFFIASMMCAAPLTVAAADALFFPVPALFGEFKANEAAANQKYMNKRITIEGEIHKIDNSAEKREIIFDAGGNGADTVVCRLHKSVKGNLNQISKGRSVVMVGAFSAFEENSIRLVDCIFGQFRRK